MSTFVVPSMSEKPWPTLGPAICDLIEERAIFGPGSLKGKRAVLDDEKRALVYRAYEVYPRGHALAGRRRFRRVRISLRKGTAKTEFGAWLAFAELHPDGPVRFDGWKRVGSAWVPVGRPVPSPYVPMLAYTQEQVEELAYGVLLTVCQEGPDAHLFDSSATAIIRLSPHGRADGKAVALAGSPNARDGALTTFAHYDEPHRLDTDRLVSAYNTMEANLPKRPLDEPWSLGTTTAGEPGGGSVAEIDKDEAESIDRGEIHEPELFYFHREASAGHDLTTFDGRLEAVREASGPAAEWSDLRSIAKQWDRPGADKEYLERVWLNRWTQTAAQAFDAKRWRDDLARAGYKIPRGAMVTVGFDGSRWKDTTAIVVTEVLTGFQFARALWIPQDCPGEEVPVAEVDPVVDEIFSTYNVLRLYGDPAQGWDDPLSRWAGKHGKKKVIFFYTDSRNLRNTAIMCRNYAGAIKGGEISHDGSVVFGRHIGAAQKRSIRMVDDEGKPLWVMAKERHDSPNKIDLAMAGGLSWEARLHSIAAGLAVEKKSYYYGA